ncbi:MAG: hypothetical protein LBI45_07040 [Bacteroidales bacterium]|nr:hypothetical protein [Bacteroidales bacterium]
MPTRQELQKLCGAGSVWTSINSVNGRKFGSGSNTVFLPAAGSRDGTSLYGAGVYSGYWSSTQYSSTQYINNHAYDLNFSNGYADPNDYTTRASGISCRCVAEE